VTQKVFGYFSSPIEDLEVDILSGVRIYNEAQKRGYKMVYIYQKTLSFENGALYAQACEMNFFPDRDKIEDRYEQGEMYKFNMHDLDVLFFRKPPPLNEEYMAYTYFLEALEEQGVLCINSPKGMRGGHSKLQTLKFPEYIIPTLFSLNVDEIVSFVHEHKKAVIKPLDAKGGEGILMLHHDDLNLKSMIETVRKAYGNLVIVQKFIPEAVTEGDKRVLLFDGKPYGAMLRQANKSDFRTNVTAGGTFVKTDLTDREKEICDVIGEYLRDNGLFMVGLDLIGGYITEINCTTPGAMTYINKLYDIKLEEKFMDIVDEKTQAKP